MPKWKVSNGVYRQRIEGDGMQKADSFTDKTIGEIVAEDYRTAAVFEKHRIDFCCGGQAALSAICQQKGLDPLVIAGEIREAMSTPVDRSQNYTTWSLSFLVDTAVSRRLHRQYPPCISQREHWPDRGLRAQDRQGSRSTSSRGGGDCRHLRQDSSGYGGSSPGRRGGFLPRCQTG